MSTWVDAQATKSRILSRANSLADGRQSHWGILPRRHAFCEARRGPPCHGFAHADFFGEDNFLSHYVTLQFAQRAFVGQRSSDDVIAAAVAGGVIVRATEGFDDSDNRSVVSRKTQVSRQVA